MSARNQARTLAALAVTAAFMVAEVAGGLISGSLALLADAAHMLSDVAALGLAWIAFRLAERPASTRRTYGYHRAQIVAAFVNGLTQILIVGWIAWEALQRLANPQPVLGGVMLWVAVAGLAANTAAFALLHGADRRNLNIRGAMIHVLGDLLGSVAAIAAAGVILLTGWTPIDPILSLFVATLVLWNAGKLVREAGHILLEGAPAGLDSAAISEDLVAAIPEVSDVHHVHAWSLTQERPLVTLHARVDETADTKSVLERIHRRLREAFGIDHATVQIEPGPCPDEPPHKGHG